VLLTVRMVISNGNRILKSKRLKISSGKKKKRIRPVKKML
jgi:hypothetical protein